MFILVDGTESKSTITNVDSKCEQPNAIDLRLAAVYKIDQDTPFDLSENGKQMRRSIQMEPGLDGRYILAPGCAYQIEFDNFVEIAEDECGWIIPRSTLNRNGVFLMSGLYDAGFKNTIGAVLYNFSGYSTIMKGTRVGQFLLAKAETRHLYDGQYQSK